MESEPRGAIPVLLPPRTGSRGSSLLSAPCTTSSPSPGVLAGAACRRSQATPRQGSLASAALLAAREALETFPSSLITSRGSEQARFHHSSQAGTSLLSAGGEIKGCNSGPFSYRRRLGGSGFKFFCPSCWSSDLQGIALTTCAF